MIPSAANSDYPKFVADQVLTSDNLNDLFGYLDEQGRITRTNLLGIGIVCGLEVKTGSDGSISITKGVGVTSSGYLITVPEVRYTKRTSGFFDAVKCEYYSKFVNISAKTQLLNLWELKQEAEEDGTTRLDNSFLADREKIVLIFVELLDENNKNCDPNSCDDKGIKVTVNFRPLLVEKADVGGLVAGAGSAVTPWLSLPPLSMRRFDVPATPLFECLNFFQAFQTAINPDFLKNTQKALSNSYDILKGFLADNFPENPFETMDADFKFLSDGSISPDQLIMMQYYYDLFSDVIMAYIEFRKTGLKVIGMCCPDDIFPRHLLLGSAKPETALENSPLRHYFIPSPILSDQKKTVTHLRILFKKLVLLIKHFSVPSPKLKKSVKGLDETIRITPSKLADVPFSDKSIPYYYSIENASNDLLHSWNPEKYLQGISNRNLSYHALNYNTNDEDIREPLLYDLEPYNFLRIEGHIGKPYQQVVRNISALRDKNRLPFDIVALSADISAVKEFVRIMGRLLETGGTNSQATLKSLMGTNCHFNDLELLYDSIMTELTGKLSNEMKFFYDLNRYGQRPPLEKQVSNISQVPLLVKTDTTFNFTANSIGHDFELFYQIIKDKPFISLEVFFQSFDDGGNAGVKDILFRAILYYIEMVYETVTPGLDSFNFYNFYIRYYSFIQTIKYIKLLNKVSSERFPVSEEENDHLDALLSITADTRMQQLYMEYLRRILQVKVLQNAGFYLNSHPGIQHKAGVPMGGTFILIYHEKGKLQTRERIPPLTHVEVGTVRHEEKEIAVQEESVFIGRFRETIKAELEIEKRKKSEYQMKENPTTQDHLRMVSSDVRQKMYIARDKIYSGLEKSIQVESAYAGKGYSETNDSIIKSNIEKDSLSSGLKNDNQPVRDYLLKAEKYYEIRKGNNLDEVIEDFVDGAVIADFYLPYTCCSDCPTVQMIISGDTEKPNQPPIARPGDSVSVQLPVNSVMLDGSSSSDPDGVIKTYLWEKISGPEAIIEKPGESKAEVTKLTVGVYEFNLTVTDDDGAQNSSVVTVTVMALENIPPVAQATAIPSVVTLSENNEAAAKLIGSGSRDEDGEIQFFEWSLSSGPTAGLSLQNADEEIALATFEKAGNYVFKLIVTDNDGAKDTTTASVVVNGRENKPPVPKATANPKRLMIVEGQSATSSLESTGSLDPDGTIKSLNWSLLSGGSGVTILASNDPTTSVEFSQPGNYTFQLTVTDNDGVEAFANVSVNVSRQETPLKKCASLRSIFDQFEEFRNTDNQADLKSFEFSYQVFQEVKDFYSKMNEQDVFSMNVEKQVEFFMQSEIEWLLPTWIGNLKKLIAEDSKLRTLSLSMLHMHTRLSYYISCIQQEDVNMAKVKMATSLNVLADTLKSVLQGLPNFTEKQKQVVAELKGVTVTERKNMKNNKEESSKPFYVRMLEGIIRMFK